MFRFERRDNLISVHDRFTIHFVTLIQNIILNEPNLYYLSVITILYLLLVLLTCETDLREIKYKKYIIEQ